VARHYWYGISPSSPAFYNAKYRGGVRRTEGLENAGSGGDRVRFPLPLLIVDETGRECPQGKGVSFHNLELLSFQPLSSETTVPSGSPLYR